MTRRSCRAEAPGVGGVAHTAGSAPSSGRNQSPRLFFSDLFSSRVVLLRPGEEQRLSEHFLAPIHPPIKRPNNSFRNSTRRLVRRWRPWWRRLWMWTRHPEEPQKYLSVYDVLFCEDNTTFRRRRYRRSSNAAVKRCRHSILYKSCGRAEGKRKTPH